MSSLRNAIQRRNHRERNQPLERAKWGLLEKRKDYKLRAADHKTKQRKISALKTKAAERNEDEFYFGMTNATSVGGVKRSRRGEENIGGAKRLSEEVVRLMKTQDRGYLQTMWMRVRRERERVEREVLAGTVGVKVEVGEGRVVFGEDGEVVDKSLPEGDEDEEDCDMDLDGLDGEESEGSAQEDEDDKDLTPEERAVKRRKRHALDGKRKKLAALKEQEEKLAAALEGVDKQRAKMAGTVGGVNKNGVKFKVRQRKR